MFKDREKLRPDYVPEGLPHREREVKSLAEILAPAVKSIRPSNVFIYGLPGTGKTAVVKYVLNNLSQALGKFSEGAKLAYCYINCKYENTAYRTLSSICERLKVKVPFTGLSVSEVFRRLVKGLEDAEKLLIVVLDEIDTLARRDEGNVLYMLTRVNLELSRSKLSLIGITNDLKFTESLDPRVKSALGEEELVFKPYSSDELRDILELRSKLAFVDGALENEVVPLCATLAAREHGDARKALDLLRVAGEVTEREGAVKVTEAHVRKAQMEIERDAAVEVLRSMPLHGKLTLIAAYLLNRRGIKDETTGEVYSLYREVCRRLKLNELTQRRISDLINELDAAGLITARVVSRGRRGLTKIIKLNVDERAIREGLREDERLSLFL